MSSTVRRQHAVTNELVVAGPLPTVQLLDLRKGLEIVGVKLPRLPEKVQDGLTKNPDIGIEVFLSGQLDYGRHDLTALTLHRVNYRRVAPSGPFFATETRSLARRKPGNEIESKELSRRNSHDMASAMDGPQKLVAQIEVIQQILDQLKEAVAAIDSAHEADAVWFPASPEGRVRLLREYGRSFKERVSVLMTEIDSSITAISEDAQSLRR